jgi:hypothetical protein
MKIETLKEIVRLSNQNSFRRLLQEKATICPLFKDKEHTGDESVVVGKLKEDSAPSPANGGRAL